MKVLIYGSVNIDYTYHVKEIVKPGETIHCTFMGKAAGGKGANQAYATGRALEKKCEVFFAGKAGHDADFIFEKLEEAGVSCKYVTYSEYGTGVAIIQVADNGENSILVCGNGNLHIEKNEIDGVLDNFAEGDCVILNGEINNLGYVMDRCYQKGMKIFFNPSPVTEELCSLPLEKASYLIFNEVEGSYFSGSDSKADCETVLERLVAKYPTSKIVLTMGDKGALCGDKTGSVYVPAYSVNVVDTTGCGDTFLGFFAAEVIKGKSLKEALEIASKAAGIAATKPGAVNSIPEYGEVVTNL